GHLGPRSGRSQSAPPRTCAPARFRGPRACAHSRPRPTHAGRGRGFRALAPRRPRARPATTPRLDLAPAPVPALGPAPEPDLGLTPLDRSLRCDRLPVVGPLLRRAHSTWSWFRGLR